MEPMLTQDDLRAIGTIVGEQIDEKVPKIINTLVPPMLEELELRMNTKFDAVHESLEGLEERMDTKFDAVHEGMEAMENRLVSKSYLDDKLAHFVKKPF